MEPAFDFNSSANTSIDRWSINGRLNPEELRVFVPSVLGVICALGVACNLTAMCILLTNSHKGKLSLINSLVFNMMFADGLVLLFSVPFKAVSFSKASWTLGWMVCKTSDWFLHTCMAAKSFTVALMAKACYRYVANPTKQVSLRLGSIIVVLFFIWLSSCCITIPHWLFTFLKNGIQVAMAMLWLPQWVVWVWEKHLAEKKIENHSFPSPPLLLTITAQLLTFSMSLVNPLIVLSLSEEFREGYKGLWRCLTLRKQPPPKAKPGPHNPTSLRSPSPRPQVSVQSTQESSLIQSASQDQLQCDEKKGKDDEGIVLPDVEQFWHEREGGSQDAENDPVPWENQDKN
uniref:G-protein coupled receptors family 1 profile domain-containing protein n=1 Tax=Knipowitschia caucasica TaxID=637954 RepID=A0AAV2MKR1_KNICA